MFETQGEWKNGRGKALKKQNKRIRKKKKRREKIFFSRFKGNITCFLIEKDVFCEGETGRLNGRKILGEDGKKGEEVTARKGGPNVLFMCAS